MTHEADDLEHASAVADAELAVARHLGWVVAVLAGASMQLAWSQWLVSALAAAAGYGLAIFHYQRKSASAMDAYHRAIGFGKYGPPRPPRPVPEEKKPS
jgi:hypothetical protein